MRLLFANKTLAALIFVCLAATTSSHAQENSQNLTFKRCQVKHKAVEIDAECATLTRPENPNEATGKSIDLFVVKLPSSSPNPVSYTHLTLPTILLV